jgi:GTP-binding protein Era
MDGKISTTPFRSGFAAVMGRPNVGKSSLVNALLKQKVAAVSPRPQTTRKRQMGILTLPDAQVIFIDTPGVHKPRHKLGEAMNQEAIQTLEHCDVILLIVEADQKPTAEDIQLVDVLKSLRRRVPVILVLNKIDKAAPAGLEENQAVYQSLLPGATMLAVSATRGDGQEQLLQHIIQRLPEGSSYFPDDQITDLYERDLAADLIREAALNILRDEVPHGIAVRIDQFTERDNEGAYIEATVFVERESHKGIVIGESGMMLKKIGTAARKEIEAMSARKVFLRLNVKVRKNWRNDERVLRWFGY